MTDQTPIDTRPTAREGTRGWPQIAAGRKRIEGQFLKLGDKLEILSAGLTRMGEPLAALGALQGRTWGEISEGLDTLDGRINALAEAMFYLSSASGAVIAIAQELSSDVGNITRTIRAMKIVALNARVSATALTNRDSGLEVFTATAGELIERADTTLRDVQELILGVLRRVQGPIETCLSGAWNEIEAVQGRLGPVRATVAEIQSANGQNAHFGAALENRLAHLRANISNTLISLQAGDKARQRLHHAEEIAARSLRERSPAMMALAREQLGAAMGDFMRDVAAIDHQMVDTLRRCQRIAAPAAKPDDRQDRGAIGDTVQSISQRMEALRKQRAVMTGEFSQIVALFGALDEALRDIGRLESQMRIVGVNAVISCSRLGTEGMALKEVANQLAALAADNAVQFRQMKARLTAVEEHTASLTGEAAERPSVLIEQIEGESTALLGKLQEIFQQRSVVAAGMSEMVELVELRLPLDLRDIRALLDGMQLGMRSLGAAPMIQGQSLDPTAGDEIFALYSMDCERDLHREFCARNGLPAPNSQVASAPAFAANIDDIFF